MALLVGGERLFLLYWWNALCPAGFRSNCSSGETWLGTEWTAGMGFEVHFDRPIFLALFLLLPIIFLISYKSLAGLGPFRRWFAILLRTAVFSLLVLAISQMQWQQKTDRL